MQRDLDRIQRGLLELSSQSESAELEARLDVSLRDAALLRRHKATAICKADRLLCELLKCRGFVRAAFTATGDKKKGGGGGSEKKLKFCGQSKKHWG